MNRYKIAILVNNTIMFLLSVILMIVLLRFALSTETITEFRLMNQHSQANWYIAKNILASAILSGILYGLACLSSLLNEIHDELTVEIPEDI